MVSASLEPDTAAARMRLGLELSAVADAMRAQRFRRENPSLGEDGIEALMEAWRGTRPGAETGDAPGRPTTWPRKR